VEIHLGLGATATSEPEFEGDAMDWYASYSERHVTDGAEGRLVSMYSFKEPWTTWEMHPNGDEVVLCTNGSITLHQELEDGAIRTVRLGPGEYAINAPGVWHTADVDVEATVLFITAGLGTDHKPR
jgi:quercetin dioxygenase-like cupin family protein